MPSGLMRFIVSPSSRITPQVAERAYLAGPDQIPWNSRNRLLNGELSIERNVSDSGKFYIPWSVEGQGELTLCTGTLMERDQPYHLLVELARGKINQIRNQMAEWQAIGLVVPSKVASSMHRALGHLSLAVTAQQDVVVAAGHSERAIESALEVADLLVNCYVEQALAVRHRHAPRLGTLVGVDLGNELVDEATSSPLLKASNSAIVPLVWRDIEAAEGFYQWDVADRQIEWCEAAGLTVCAGPLLRLDTRGLPDWLYLWQGDFDNIQSFVSDYVETAVGRYKGRVHMWHCASRINVGDALSLREEERLRLAARAIEITRDVDPGTPVIVRFDQPWAEYMGRTDPDLSPLHFADALVRTGMQLSGIGLEINMGYYPGGSYPRDRLECSRLLDLWSFLGLPLQVLVTIPSGPSDATARGGPAPLAGAPPGGWTPKGQAAWVERFLPVMMAKPAVQAVFWNQLYDQATSEFPNGGLIDSAKAIKPALAEMAALRKKHLD